VIVTVFVPFIEGIENKGICLRMEKLVQRMQRARIVLICMTCTFQKGPQFKIAWGPENENSPLAKT